MRMSAKYIIRRHAHLRAALVGMALALPVGAAHAASLQVVATTTILGDVTSSIAGPHATVTTLMPPGADPHQFSPSARQAAQLRRADLVVVNGLGLESAPMRRVLDAAAADGARIVVAGDASRPRSAPDGTVDPHFWTDPRRMELAAQRIAQSLAGRLPAAGGRAVGLRGRAYRAQLLREDGRSRARFATIPAARRVLVTNHHVLGYLANRYGFRTVGAIVPSTSTLASASAADVAKLAGQIRRHRVPAIFVDSSSPTTLARVLARESGVRVKVVALYSESLGPRGSSAGTYLGMVRTNTARIVAGLRD